MASAMWVVVALAAGCDVRVPVGVTPDGGAGDETWAEVRLGTATRDVDLLFVLDDSPGMAARQAQLQRDFDAFTNELTSLRPVSGAGHLHLGVVTSDLGAGPFSLDGCQAGGRGGRLQALGAAADPSCLPPSGARYIDLDRAEAMSNLPADQDLEATFRCLSAVGDAGCGFPQPLEAARRALVEPPPENAGFRRAGAILALAFVTDADDCSAPPDGALFDPARAELGPPGFRCTQWGVRCGNPPQPPSATGSPLADCMAASGDGLLYDLERYTDLLRVPASSGGLAANPNDVLVFALAAPPEPFAVTLAANPDAGSPSPTAPCASPSDPGCEPRLEPSCVSPDPGGGAGGAPAVRLAAALAEAPGAGGSICDGSYGEALRSWARALLAAEAGGGCLPAPLKAPNAPRCEVIDQRIGPDGTVETRLPPCVQAGAARPCWALETLDTCPPRVSAAGQIEQLHLVVERDGLPQPASEELRTRARCVVEAAVAKESLARTPAQD